RQGSTHSTAAVRGLTGGNAPPPQTDSPEKRDDDYALAPLRRFLRRPVAGTPCRRPASPAFLHRQGRYPRRDRGARAGESLVADLPAGWPHAGDGTAGPAAHYRP